MDTYSNVSNKNSVKLYKIAAYLLLGTCCLHFMYFTYRTYDSFLFWFTGGLWHLPPKTLTDVTHYTHFWALPGSFMVPLFLLSLLILRAARHKQYLPSYIGWGLLLWASACWLIMLPSGFILGIPPAILLIVANRKAAIV